MSLWPPGWESDHLEDDRAAVPPGEAAARLRHRSRVINLALAVYPLAAVIAVTSLAFAFWRVSDRADRVASSVADIARFDNQARAYLACLGDPNCPPERRQFLLKELATDVARAPNGSTPGVPEATLPVTTTARPTARTRATTRPSAGPSPSSSPAASPPPAPTTSVPQRSTPTTTRPPLLCRIVPCDRRL